MEKNKIVSGATSILAGLDSYGELENHDFSGGDTFRGEITRFVVSQMRTIAEQDTFRKVIIDELIVKIEMHELDAKELLSVYRAISNEKSINTQAILDVFKPTGQATTPLLQGGQDADDPAEVLTPEQMQALMTLVQAIQEEKEKRDRDKEEGNHED